MKIIFILLLFPLAVIAQTNTNKAINKGESDLKALKGLFSKHKKDSAVQKQTDSQVTHQQASSNSNIAKTSPDVLITPGVGELAENAKTVDADELGFFNAGAALVKKGQLIGLINSKGDFIVPYGKYNFNFTPANIPQIELNNGMFDFVTPPSSGVANVGIINYAGKVIASNLKYRDMTMDETGQLAFIIESSGKSYFIDKEGKKMPTAITQSSGQGSHFSDGLSETFNLDNKNTFWCGYMNYKGDLVIPRVYNKFNQFSGGVAIVGKIDSYGVIKYGVINTKGETVFPFILNSEPTNLHNGFTSIARVNDPECEYVIINKEGKIMIKLTRDDRLKYGLFIRFIGGYFFSGKGPVMDTSGNKFSEDAFCSAKYSLNVTQNCDIYVGGYSEAFSIANKIPIKAKIKNDSNGSANMAFGFIDLATGKYLLSENLLTRTMYFDPKTGLAYAECAVGKDANRRAIVRKGYIDEAGKFVIVKSEDSKW